MQNKVVILGINCAYHESSACLVVDGQLISVVEAAPRKMEVIELINGTTLKVR